MQATDENQSPYLSPSPGPLAAGVTLAAFGLPALPHLLQALENVDLPSMRALSPLELRQQETVAAVSAACSLAA